MTCKDCGKELKYLRDMTESEIKDFSYSGNMRQTAELAIRHEAIDLTLFKGEQIYEYFLAAYHQLAEANFLNEIQLMTVGKEFNVNYRKIAIEDNKFWLHED